MEGGFMGKQFGFVMDEKDKKKFLDYVLENGKIYSDEKHLNTELLSELLKNGHWLKIYFSVKDEMKITYTLLSNGRKYINSDKESVIEFRNTNVYESDTRILRGRLWVEMKYYDNEGELRTKRKELDELYKNLCKWIKKNLKKVTVEEDGSTWKEYVSESMIGLVEEGYSLHG